MGQLENDLRVATGRMEELSFQISQLTEQLSKMSSDVDFRLSQLEGGAPVASAQGFQQQSGQALGQFAQQATGQQPAPAPTPRPAPAQIQAQAQAAQGGGVQSLGSISESDLANAQTSAGQLPSQIGDTGSADLLDELSEDGPAITGVSASGEPLTAPAPQTAPQTASVAAQGTTALSAPTQTASLPEGTPREKYMHAFGLLRQGKYDVAATALQSFLGEHGDDALAGNARYWLGETFYVRGAFVEAAETFLEGYQTDPQGAKAADSLLKLGMALSNLDKKQEACAAFDKLRADFPNASQGLRNTLQREWQKNGCV